jgi:hypothetical protein
MKDETRAGPHPRPLSRRAGFNPAWNGAGMKPWGLISNRERLWRKPLSGRDFNHAPTRPWLTGIGGPFVMVRGACGLGGHGAPRTLPVFLLCMDESSHVRPGGQVWLFDFSLSQ